MKKLLLLAALLLHIFCSFGQKVIKGQVIDKQTQEGIRNATVFIDNTQLGTTTNRTGKFSLPVSQNINSVIVISCVGYKTISIEMPQSDSSLLIPLEKIIEELDGVTIVGKRSKPVLGKKWQNIFLTYFLGNNQPAADCDITNLNKISFFLSDDENRLRAHSNEIILIVNKWLGYKIYYEIIEFEINLTENTVVNYGYSKFEDISNGDEKFLHRRENKYCGSLSHFLRSLYVNNHAQNGFEIKRATIEINSENERVRTLAKQNGYQLNFTFETLGNKRTPLDSSKYYYKVYIANKKYSVVTQHALLAPDNLFITDLEIFKELYFKDYLLVNYKHGNYEQSINNSMASLAFDNKYQSAMLKLKDDNSVLLYPNGRFDPPKSLIIAGAWANSNAIANMLPLDFTCACRGE
ncbi:carboxypeptidase-like regulatory domain-containing protein [Niabella ginsengisoli]|uniref:Carboxypeptidase-like regulatory domain-containing protein n=1 Tax=Niabella ginsengisoli TaxID=522298 RepID=A0ABS9SP21_9BACT|nr:carboxypeptidase-like regulatory domain-containing protein [Niabella ginsengisoli]MCH5600127.1 carboxypeptidase-like regulatory domain-containing protein [Niabella ginsengisoli]